MRKLKSLAYLFIAASLLFTSCGGDDETDPIAPTVSLTSSSPITGDVTKASTDTLTFIIDLRQGDANLETLTIREGAGSAAPTAPNPNAYTVSTSDGSVVDAETDGNYDVKDNAIMTIKFNPKGLAGTYTYVFGLTDKDGVSATALEVTVTIADASVTSYTAKLIQTPSSGENNKAFYSSSDNETYSFTTATADPSIQSKIDFGYVYVSSAILYSPSTYTVSGSNDVAGEWTNKNVTSFAATSIDFATATADQISSVDYSSSSTDSGALAVDDVVAFKTASGVFGVFKVTALQAGFGSDDSITIEVKIVE